MILRLAGRLTILTLLLTIFFSPQSALANGGKGRVQNFIAKFVDEKNGINLEFDINIDPEIFRLTAFRNKYKLIRIEITNKSERPFSLSKTADRIALSDRYCASTCTEPTTEPTINCMESSSGGPPFKGPGIVGIIDLATRDSKFWDSLDMQTRLVLAYPKNVPALEEESVFVFFPNDAIKEAPLCFGYALQSLHGQHISIGLIGPLSTGE